ncbi:uncharacterized protein METZ01_LOCUS288641, partial [marine metagenome]
MTKNLPYILIAFGVAGLVAFLSFFDLYETIENKLLDMRFKNRGLMETRNDIATVDIDDIALRDVGRWEPWSRDKHIPLVRAADEHDMDAFLFDIYFIEESERELNIKDLDKIEDSILTKSQLKKSFSNPDSVLADAAEKAGNIIFAQKLTPQPKKKKPLEPRTDVKNTRLALLEQEGYVRKIDNPAKFSTIFDFYDIEIPLESLIKKGNGVYYFQGNSDPDGVARKYPLIGLYDNRLFPSAALAIALDHYGVSFNEIDIEPGKHIRFDLPPDESGNTKEDEYGRSEIIIPINEKGMMQVNWAGPWEDKVTAEFDVMHYPYTVIKRFQEIEHSNFVLANYKRLANQSFNGNIKATL